MNDDKRKPGEDEKSDKRRQPLKLSKETLRTLSVQSGIKVGFSQSASEGPRCIAI